MGDAPRRKLAGLESFDVAVDFPLGYLCAVEVPFFAFFMQEIFEGGFAQCFTHQIAGFQLVKCFL